MRYTRDTWPSERWPNFTFDEIACRHTGECDIDPDFMDDLQTLREDYCRPMRITSGYRHPTHPVEAGKARPGAHALGVAVDVAVAHVDALALLHFALEHGFEGIGVAQKGDPSGRYLHLDMAPRDNPNRPRPAIWSY